MGKGKTYTDDFKEQVVQDYGTIGLHQTWVKHGRKITKTVITTWAKKAGVPRAQTEVSEKTKHMLEERTAKIARLRKELQDGLISNAVTIGKRIAEIAEREKKDGNKQNGGALREYSVAQAILIDKYRLETGEATERHEMLGKEAKETLKQKIDELAARRTKTASGEQGTA